MTPSPTPPQAERGRPGNQKQTTLFLFLMAESNPKKYPTLTTKPTKINTTKAKQNNTSETKQKYFQHSIYLYLSPCSSKINNTVTTPITPKKHNNAYKHFNAQCINLETILSGESNQPYNYYHAPSKRLQESTTTRQKKWSQSCLNNIFNLAHHPLRLNMR